jgi:hypothetical protein
MVKTVNECQKNTGFSVPRIVSAMGVLTPAIREKRFCKFFIIIITLLLVTTFNLMTSASALADLSQTVEITGDGVETPVTFTLDELQDMEQYQQVYSTINTWPTKRFYVGQGVRLRYLLDLAGIKEDARLIRFISEDGYEVTLTVKELLKDKRYYFPYLTDNSASDGSVPGASLEKQEVESMLALASAESSTNPDEMNDMNALLFICGQRAVTEQTNNWFLKHVSKIEVLTTAPEKWDKPKASINSEEVAAGTLIELSSKSNDTDKVYYTTDGSTPTINSPMFNWSAKRWWTQRPDTLKNINKPIEINRDTVIKAKTIGPGKEDSEVVTFSYKVGLTDSLGHNVPPTGVTLDRDIINLKVGGTFELDATVGPDNALDKNVTWSSSDTSVATVDNHGLVTMIGPGTAVITAKTVVGDLEATCTVTSRDKDDDIQSAALIETTPKEDEKPDISAVPAVTEIDRQYAEQKEAKPIDITKENETEALPEPEPEVLQDNQVYLAKKELASVSSPELSQQPDSQPGQLFEVSVDTAPLQLPTEQSCLSTHTLPIFIILLFTGAGKRYMEYTKEVAR